MVARGLVAGWFLHDRVLQTYARQSNDNGKNVDIECFFFIMDDCCWLQRYFFFVD